MIHPKALTIAGSDSGGGAGIQADLKTFSALGVYGASVITSVTAQNTQYVSGIMAVTADMIQKQIDAVMTDIRPLAVKTGMLSTSEIITTVAESVKRPATVQAESPAPPTRSETQPTTGGSGRPVMRNIALDLGSKGIAVSEVRNGVIIQRWMVADERGLEPILGANTPPARVACARWRVG